MTETTPTHIVPVLITSSRPRRATNVGSSRGPPGAWLLGHVPSTEGGHRIAEIAADSATARSLEINLEMPCLPVSLR